MARKKKTSSNDMNLIIWIILGCFICGLAVGVSFLGKSIVVGACTRWMTTEGFWQGLLSFFELSGGFFLLNIAATGPIKMSRAKWVFKKFNEMDGVNIDCGGKEFFTAWFIVSLVNALICMFAMSSFDELFGKVWDGGFGSKVFAVISFLWLGNVFWVLFKSLICFMKKAK